MHNLEKTLNLKQGVGILTSTLLGSGIFIVPAMVANIAGSDSLIAWLLMIILMLPIAFTFGQLGAKYPDASGTAFFVEKSLNKGAGTIISWLYLSVIPIGPPVVIITGANYLGATFNATQSQICFISIFMLVLLFIINLFGIKFSSNIQTIISIVIGIILSVIIIFGIFKMINNTSIIKLNFFSNGFKLNMGKALAMMFWCFVGIEAVAHLASEFKDVKKDFPKAITISIVSVGIFYMLIGFMVLQFGTFGGEEKNTNSLVELMNILVGSYGKFFIGLMGFLTCLAAVNLYLLSCSRLLYSMNKNGVLSKINRKNIPVNSFIVTFLMVTITVLAKQIFSFNLSSLISYANGVFILIYISAMFSGIKLLDKYKKILSTISMIICFVILYLVGITAIYGINIFIIGCIGNFLIKNQFIKNIIGKSYKNQ